MTTDSEAVDIRNALAIGSGAAAGGKAMGTSFLKTMGGTQKLKTLEAWKNLLRGGAKPHSRILGAGVVHGGLGAGGGLLTGILLTKALRSGEVKVPGMRRLRKEACVSNRYHFWEKSADEITQTSTQEEPRSDPLRTSSTPQAEGVPDPHEEDKHKLDLEAQEQLMQHKQELHEQRLRHTEELHSLKVQSQGAAAGGSSAAASQQQAAPPMDPQQAQAASQTNLLANYIQSKMGEESPTEEEAAEEEGNPITIEQVRDFLRSNTSPEDSEFHQWAESLGVSPHAAEELAYQLAAQQVTGQEPEDTTEGGPGEAEKEAALYQLGLKVAKELVQGGRAEGKPSSDFPEDQIRKGIKVEKEHTPDPAIAEEISRDHLEEFPNYYTALDKMEGELKSQKEKKAAFYSKIAEVLTQAKRDDLSKKQFALPKQEAYPINDPSHARNALARVSQHGTPSEKATVRSKVKAKYPGIEVSKKAEWQALKAQVNSHIAKHAFGRPEALMLGGIGALGAGIAAPALLRRKKTPQVQQPMTQQAPLKPPVPETARG